MIPRKLTAQLEQSLRHSSTAVLLGPRQIGKTTLALDVGREFSSVYLDLERPSDLLKVADIEAYCDMHAGELIILDEIQRTPEIFAPLRSIIDQRRRDGMRYAQFLLLGSASLELLNQSSESLAGRISLHELFGLAVDELGAEHLDSLWMRGGFPDSFTARDDLTSLHWRQDFIRSYLERDVPLLGPRIPAETLRRFWTMLAHQQAQLFNAASLGRNLDLSSVTIHRYLDLLVDLLLVRRLPAWFSNVGKRLIKSPKIYIRDSGLCHALLDIRNLDELLGHPVIGGSWEGFVIENIASCLSKQARLSFFRDSNGAEIDLIIEGLTAHPWAIEIKRGRAPVVSKGFHSASETIGAERRIVIHGGSESYPLPGNVEAMPLLAVMEELSRT